MFALRWILVTELAQVPVVRSNAPAADPNPAEDSKDHGTEPSAGNRKTRPLHNLAPQISAGDVLKHESLWDLVSCLPSCAQVAQDEVRADVCSHAKEKENVANDGARRPGLCEASIVATVKQI